MSLISYGPLLMFTVADDGRGFDPATTPAGSGLQGITDRLAALGGTIDIASAPGHGTQVTGRVPAVSDRGVSQHGHGPSHTAAVDRDLLCQITPERKRSVAKPT